MFEHFYELISCIIFEVYVFLKFMFRVLVLLHVILYRLLFSLLPGVYWIFIQGCRLTKMIYLS